MSAIEASFAVRALAGDALQRAVPALVALFVDAVEDGASIGYLPGQLPGAAERYWADVAREPGSRVVLVAEDGDGISGVVVVAPCTAPFQRHRADIVKLVVHRRARGRGIGAALMRRAEDEAAARERTLLTLQTRRGSDGERLYRTLGWMLAGVIPDDSLTPDGALCDACIFYKRVGR